MAYRQPRALDIAFEDEVTVNCMAAEMNACPELAESAPRLQHHTQLRPIPREHETGTRSLDYLSEDMQRLEVREKVQRDEPFASFLVTSPQDKLIFDNNDDGFNALHVAAANGELEHVVALVRQARHDPRILNLRDDGGSSALHWALHERQIQVAGLLVLAGASVLVLDASGMTSLHLAVAFGDVASLAMLLQTAAKTGAVNATTAVKTLNRYTNEGLTGFHLAASSGNAEMINELKLLGTDVNARDAKSGRTALHFCVEAGNEAMVDFLLSVVGVAPNVLTYSLHSALDLAEGRGEQKICALLRQHGASKGSHEESDSEPEVDVEM